MFFAVRVGEGRRNQDSCFLLNDIVPFQVDFFIIRFATCCCIPSDNNNNNNSLVNLDTLLNISLVGKLLLIQKSTALLPALRILC